MLLPWQYAQNFDLYLQAYINILQNTSDNLTSHSHVGDHDQLNFWNVLLQNISRRTSENHSFCTLRAHHHLSMSHVLDRHHADRTNLVLVVIPFLVHLCKCKNFSYSEIQSPVVWNENWLILWMHSKHYPTVHLLAAFNKHFSQTDNHQITKQRKEQNQICTTDL